MSTTHTPLGYNKCINCRSFAGLREDNGLFVIEDNRLSTICGFNERGSNLSFVLNVGSFCERSESPTLYLNFSWKQDLSGAL